jgi:hypothetical protein
LDKKTPLGSHAHEELPPKNGENRTMEKTVGNEIMTRLKSQQISKMKNWTQWRTDGGMDGWTDGRTDGWMDGRTDGWTDSRPNVPSKEQVSLETDKNTRERERERQRERERERERER